MPNGDAPGNRFDVERKMVQIEETNVGMPNDLGTARLGDEEMAHFSLSRRDPNGAEIGQTCPPQEESSVSGISLFWHAILFKSITTESNMTSKVFVCIILFFYVSLSISASVVEAGNKADTINRPPSLYKVFKLNKTMPIDANWNKSEWKKVKPIKITNYMGELPAFRPQTEVKMMYDDDNVYVIFRVKDRFVRSLVQEYNGNVSGDACVEFFFAPDARFPERYFNLEINAGGTPLMFYIPKPYRTEFTKLDSVDLNQIEIAHSLPRIVDPEITEPVTWTLEYRIPLSLLEKFSNVKRPGPGVVWKANFYKTASRKTNSNPHYITWAVVESPRPNFHLPQFFGTLEFK